ELLRLGERAVGREHPSVAVAYGRGRPDALESGRGDEVPAPVEPPDPSDAVAHESVQLAVGQRLQLPLVVIDEAQVSHADFFIHDGGRVRLTENALAAVPARCGARASETGSALGQSRQLDDRADLDGPNPSRRDPGGDGDRVVEVLGVDQVEPSELFL